MHCREQSVTHEALLTYACRILVAGSRGYSNYAEFCDIVFSRLKDLDLKKEDVCFITGEARTGADDLIIIFCNEFGFKWCGFPADWDQFGKRAGYLRNVEMGKVATHAMIFWDGHSRGTRHMLEYLGMSFDKKKKGKWKVQIALTFITAPKEN